MTFSCPLNALPREHAYAFDLADVDGDHVTDNFRFVLKAIHVLYF